MKAGDLVQVKESFPHDYWYSWRLDSKNALDLQRTGYVCKVLESVSFNASDYRYQIGEVVWVPQYDGDCWFYIPNLSVYANMMQEFLQILLA